MIDRSLKGIRVCPGALIINHLLFVDDSLIFCKVIIEVSNNILRILNMYAKALGQYINMENTTMVVRRNVGETEKVEISKMWGCWDMKQYENYLGLPPIIGHFKKIAFSDIKAKL